MSSSIRSGQGSDARPLTCAQPGQPGADREPLALAVRVGVDLGLQRRARPDQRHLAAQHVDQVRQLVDRRAPQERADAGDPRVALVDRHPGADVLGAGDHRAQLDDLEAVPVLADAVLAVDRVAVGLQAHRGGRDGDHRRATSSAPPDSTRSSARLRRE